MWDEDRESAIHRMARALDELAIEGVKTTQPLFRLLCDEPDVLNGKFHTAWLEQWLETLNAPKPDTQTDAKKDCSLPQAS